MQADSVARTDDVMRAGTVMQAGAGSAAAVHPAHRTGDAGQALCALALRGLLASHQLEGQRQGDTDRDSGGEAECEQDNG